MKRYNFDEWIELGHVVACMEEDEDGRYVEYEEVRILLAEGKILRKALQEISDDDPCPARNIARWALDSVQPGQSADCQRQEQ